MEIPLSPDQILSTIEKMPESELESFVRKILQIRGKRQAPNISATEADLLQSITHSIPLSLQNQFNQLIIKRQTNTINDQELQELQELSNQIEILDAQRIQQLAQLAQIRSTSIEVLIEQLHLTPVAHG